MIQGGVDKCGSDDEDEERVKGEETSPKLPAHNARVKKVFLEKHMFIIFKVKQNIRLFTINLFLIFISLL